MVKQGVQFTSDPKKRLLPNSRRRHSRRQIFRASDKTGAVVVKTLAEQVINYPNIDCFTSHMAYHMG
ncbi:hypothetical protein [Coxiella-like endosymbiont of Rhipicephalus sanguineus]|uniref:hypothetical protein n=1 Tax=Coxiella-like endosymbiont of Rhipicephalus sanguineus TaxID=1955402 RepID=UPI00203D4DE9|nr:hypothetical protein [Coxiella-like endosymbiont of Rhipicephalus sanguineus]